MTASRQKLQDAADSAKKTLEIVTMEKPTLRKANEKTDDWVKHQKESRNQLKSLSQQKKRLRLETLHKTFSKDVKKSKEKLKELELLVDHIIEKIQSFAPVLPKDQKAIKFVLEKN